MRKHSDLTKLCLIFKKWELDGKITVLFKQFLFEGDHH